jgi:hypothetical protein
VTVTVDHMHLSCLKSLGPVGTIAARNGPHGWGGRQQVAYISKGKPRLEAKRFCSVGQRPMTFARAESCLAIGRGDKTFGVLGFMGRMAASFAPHQGVT